MDIQNDKIQKALINVEALQKEYEITLQQYQEAVKNYVNTLQTNNTASNTNTNFAALQGRTWWGTKGLKEGQVNSVSECENMCAESDACSGATFNEVKRYCWTRAGDGNLSVGMNNDYALLPQQKSDLIIMKSLNDKLLSLNQEISKEIIIIQPQVEAQDVKKNVKQKQLTATYNKLLEQKIEMEKQLQEYYSVDEDNQQQSLFVSQQNLSYRFWVLLTILVVIITLRKMLGKSVTMSAIIWVFIIYVLIIFSFTISYPQGFAIWSIIILYILLMRAGYVPSP